MAIPNYLKEIGYNETKKSGRTCFEIKCTCGCEKFYVYKNKFTKEEKVLMKPFWDAFNFFYSIGYPDAHCEKRDENGKHHNYIVKECILEEIDSVSIVGGMVWNCRRDENGDLHYYEVKSGVWEEFELPEMPSFATAESYKAICSECGKEFLLFDNRFHGYDAVLASEGLSRDLEYKPTYAQKKFKDGKPRRIKFEVENFDTLEDFCEDLGEEYDEATYSNSFSWIWVYAIDENDKKSKIFEYETA